VSACITHSTGVALSEGTTPHAIAAALTSSLLELEDRVTAQGRRPIWDTLLIETHEELVDERQLAEVRRVTAYRTIELSVFTIDPKEVSA
jgi:hypothetical protein